MIFVILATYYHWKHPLVCTIVSSDTVLHIDQISNSFTGCKALVETNHGQMMTDCTNENNHDNPLRVNDTINVVEKCE